MHEFVLGEHNSIEVGRGASPGIPPIDRDVIWCVPNVPFFECIGVEALVGRTRTLELSQERRSFVEEHFAM